MRNLKDFLKKVPGGFDLDCIFRNPSWELENWLEFFRLRRRFSHVPHKKGRGKILVISLAGNSVNAAKIEILLVIAALQAGFEPLILTNRWSWANRFYLAFGINSFVYFEDFLSAASKKLKGEELPSLTDIKSFEDLMNFSFKGVNTGKYICSSLVRKTYTGNVDILDAKTKEHLKGYLLKTSINTIAATDIFDFYRPSAVLFLERGYTPYGEFFDIALKRNLNVVQWCGSHRNNALTLKRYNLRNQDQHPASLSSKTWEMLAHMNWDQEKSKAIKQELFKNYSSGEWFGEVGTQFNARLFDAELIKKELGLDLSKRTAFILPHLFWDATFFWGKDLFANYREWFIEAVKAACKNENVNWVLKLHPANTVKLNRDGYEGELVEKISIRESIGDLPPHIKILEPDTKVSTFALYQIMDYCLTVRGTPGIEAAMFGVPILTAGTGRYDGHGFTIDSVSKEDYLDKLSKIQTFPRLSDEQIELAQKFAYGTFLLRPFNLESIKITYKKDKKATQKVDFLIESAGDLAAAKDVIEFSKWLCTDDEDYIAKP